MLYILVGILLSVLIYKIFKSAKYWEGKNVVYEPSWPVVGNMGSAVLRRKHMMEILSHVYNKYPQQRYVGMMQFTRPMLLLRDVDLIKQLTVRDFESFHDHLSFAQHDNDPLLSKSLITLTGYKWKQMRATLSPVFTSSKMRLIYQLISECSENFVAHFRGKEQVAVDVKDVFTRFSNDVIATTAFGIKVDSLEDPKNSFFVMSGRFNRSIFAFAKVIISYKMPFLTKFVDVGFLPKSVADFFRTIVKDNIEKREQDGIVRRDLIHLLMEARKDASKPDYNEDFATAEESDVVNNTKRMQLNDEDIVAQAMLFFVAGFNTISISASFIAYELALHPDIQKRLQEEIDEVNKNHKKVSYETLLSMKYLDQVISEGLRLWPPGFQTERVCTKNYIIPPTCSNEREVIFEKGTAIWIPIAAIHRDARYYPDPDQFDPERFSEDNKSRIVPGTYMPFGVGPRICIGSRFALLELKTLFLHILSNFDLVPVTDTEIPMKISPKKIELGPENGFRLGFRPRKF